MGLGDRLVGLIFMMLCLGYCVCDVKDDNRIREQASQAQRTADLSLQVSNDHKASLDKNQASLDKVANSVKELTGLFDRLLAVTERFVNKSNELAAKCETLSAKCVTLEAKCASCSSVTKVTEPPKPAEPAVKKAEPPKQVPKSAVPCKRCAQAYK